MERKTQKSEEMDKVDKDGGNGATRVAFILDQHQV